MENNTDDVTCATNSYTDLPAAWQLLEKVTYPLLLAICTVGNVLVLFIWGRQFRQCSTNVYLVSMAAICLIYMWLELPVKLLAYYPASDWMTNSPNGLQTFILCSDGARLWASYTAYNSIDWILTLYSLERLAAVTRPLWIYKWMKPDYAVVAVGVTLLLAAIQNLEIAVAYYYWLPSAFADTDTPFSETRPEWLTTWDNVTSEAQLALSFGIYAGLTIINAILLMQLYRQRDAAHLLRDDSSGCLSPDKAGSWGGRTSTRVLIACSALYLFCHLPIIIQTILETLALPPYCRHIFTGDSRVIWFSVANQLSYCDYTFKFMVYCAFSQRFRKAMTVWRGKLSTRLMGKK
ncbi:uncharacterized protein LOC129582311 [Paramacrobiotus metropolitanus]|uniref:uncharacterized protein LOC129582311 n=1 Tax=Paramacrobiotus metropolitanus TaxID=2943436 RepID=UPI002445AB0D|nr:uncharacterized protein LOC129582311 [Paramacrobiotus metropolitanus]XP_055329789.1 uncharacterized protein LOC129582311 [Paramacrobiotus metropolitanus]